MTMRYHRAMADYSNDYQVTYNGQAQTCTLRFRCFDTPNAVTVHGCGQPDFAIEQTLCEVRRACLELHRLWSFSLPESDVSRVNGACERVRVDARTVELFEAMKRFNDDEPSFDFTVGPVSYLWKHASAVPSENEIASALDHVGASKIAVEDGEVLKGDPLVKVDVGGAAKGFAADLVAGLLRDANVECADVDLGGNLFMLGSHPSGRPWRVAVRVPEGIEAKPAVLEVRDKSVVTSGSYERFVEIDGTRYAHIVDARTGWPVQSDVISATVVAKSSLEADMLATTALMAGTEGIGALAERHAECGFVVIAEGGTVTKHGSVA